METALDFGKRETFIVAEIQSSVCRRAPFDDFQAHRIRRAGFVDEVAEGQASLGSNDASGIDPPGFYGDGNVLVVREVERENFCEFLKTGIGR